MLRIATPFASTVEAFATRAFAGRGQWTAPQPFPHNPTWPGPYF